MPRETYLLESWDSYAKGTPGAVLGKSEKAGCELVRLKPFGGGVSEKDVPSRLLWPQPPKGEAGERCSLIRDAALNVHPPREIGAFERIRMGAILTIQENSGDGSWFIVADGLGKRYECPATLLAAMPPRGGEK